MLPRTSTFPRSVKTESNFGQISSGVCRINELTNHEARLGRATITLSRPLQVAQDPYLDLSSVAVSSLQQCAAVRLVLLRVERSYEMDYIIYSIVYWKRPAFVRKCHAGRSDTYTRSVVNVSDNY